ncbi:GNAT family N-acetyltransferase [Nocardioides insulae]|uniref:GNAT family N-acetyltransferase n=1 Tax=Nocardioides insulae TaxID=394734 RepID=UPI00041F919C|nr:GNAT family N-acetyltransferase [Nocardioides insulae]
MTVPVQVRVDGRWRTGTAEPGESWYAAAGRISGSPAAAVWAMDLSGEVKEFSADPEPRVALRPMVTGDLRVLAGWLAQPHVRRWFGVDGEPTLANITQRYAPDLRAGSGTDLWVVEANGRSVGFCQDYLLRDHPDYPVLTHDPDSLGLDYAIGPPAMVGGGLGTRILSHWCRHARERHPGARSFFAAPDHRNLASRRVLRKLGFTEEVWFDEPEPDGSVSTVVGHTFDVVRVLGGEDTLGYSRHDC